MHADACRCMRVCVCLCLVVRMHKHTQAERLGTHVVTTGIGRRCSIEDLKAIGCAGFGWSHHVLEVTAFALQPRDWPCPWRCIALLYF